MMSKLAILTNASSELAKPLATALAASGMRLALVDMNLDAAQLIASRLKTEGIDATAYSAASSSESVQAALDAIGRPNVLITCPPTPPLLPSTDLSEADLRAYLDSSLFHAFLWNQAAGKAMLEAGSGVIVNVTGLSGMGGWPGWLASSVAWGGIHNLTHTLAVEWGKRGVRVNCLVPGVTESTMQQIYESPRAADETRILWRIPQGKTAPLEAFGQALLYLINGTFLNGEILRVDGGWDIWGQFSAVAKS
jgi:NAD(P)-dependent dehydrogenase (short-subunit alcohol dehydrogenase family)